VDTGSHAADQLRHAGCLASRIASRSSCRSSAHRHSCKGTQAPAPSTTVETPSLVDGVPRAYFSRGTSHAGLAGYGQLSCWALCIGTARLTLSPVWRVRLSPRTRPLVHRPQPRGSAPRRARLPVRQRLRARRRWQSALMLGTRTTRLAARGGRLHRPGDPRAGPRDVDVTGGATASVGHRTAASRGEPTAGPHPLRPCPGTIAFATASSSCRLCLCHARDHDGLAGTTIAFVSRGQNPVLSEGSLTCNSARMR